MIKHKLRKNKLLHKTSRERWKMSKSSCSKPSVMKWMYKSLQFLTIFAVIICFPFHVDGYIPQSEMKSKHLLFGSPKLIALAPSHIHKSRIQTTNIKNPLTTSFPQSIATGTTLYGIKGFRAWFESTFPSAMTPILTSNRSSKRNDSNAASPIEGKDTEIFDHVLIDVNQLLHVSLRRSKNEGHALTRVLKELDKCLFLARPVKSVVLAMDGPPSAAKLATQRRRRYATVVRAALKRERNKVLRERIMEREATLMMENNDYNVELNYSLSNTNTTDTNHYDNQNDESVNDINNLNANFLLSNTSKRQRKRRNMLNEEATLCITPGTAFMDKVVDAILYWAWQRMTNPSSLLCANSKNLKVYISTSDAPGEGEVKLLDWVFLLGSGSPLFADSYGNSGRQRKYEQIIKEGDSIAIMGGDSDLVLEGLILPPSITHNVFVILPDGNKKSYAVSLWETTLQLLQYLPKHLDPKEFSGEDLVMSIRTDLVLLLIMNGNDYLPKLRGSSGFNKLFNTYLKLLKRWLVVDEKRHNQKNGKNKSPSTETKRQQKRPFLVNRDSLSFNIPFCLAFFRQLARTAPKLLTSIEEMLSHQERSNSVTPLSILNTMMDTGFIPKPAVWNVIPYESIINKNDDGDNYVGSYVSTNETDRSSNEDVTLESTDMMYLDNLLNEDTDDDADKNSKSSSEKHDVLQLILGDPDSNSAVRYVFEADHRPRTTLKTTKHRLASMAMNEILGNDWRDLHDYSNRNDLDIGDDGEDDDEDVDENDALSETGFEDEDEDFDYLSSSGYTWEVRGPVNCDVEQYLAGLLWNLQTYQEGVCADYAYNYGQRMSPTAAQIVEYISDFIKNNKNPHIDRIGRKDLLGDNFTEPLDAGLSCLAALPIQAKHLIPEPYNLLTSDDIIENIYGECMDAESNVFDIKKFQERCNHEINILKKEQNCTTTNEKKEQKETLKSRRGRKITTNSKFWTVLARSHDNVHHPFAPPKPFSSRLSSLRPSKRIKVTSLKATNEPKFRSGKEDHIRYNNKNSESVSNFIQMLDDANYEEIKYKVAFQYAREDYLQEKMKNINKVEPLTKKSSKKSLKNKTENNELQKNKKETWTNPLNAIASLQCLVDAECIDGPIEWLIEKVGDLKSGEENVTLRIGGNGGFVSEMKRDDKLQRRKEVKQLLASKALDAFIGLNWKDMTLKEMKRCL